MRALFVVQRLVAGRRDGRVGAGRNRAGAAGLAVVGAAADRRDLAWALIPLEVARMIAWTVRAGHSF
jgi:hypothetical protein